MSLVYFETSLFKNNQILVINTFSSKTCCIPVLKFLKLFSIYVQYSTFLFLFSNV